MLSSNLSFFSSQTHKPSCPLKVIVSERGSWQKALAVYLQAKLNLLPIDDPFLIKCSDDVTDALVGLPSKNILDCSVDNKNLYYSIPQDALLARVEDTIDKHDVAVFQNKAGLRVGSFLELLAFDFKSMFATLGSVY